MSDILIRLKSIFDGKGTKQAEKGFKGLSKSLIAFGAAGAGALVAREALQFTKESVNLAREQAAAEAQVAAAIASTGGAAGMSLEQLKAHASALQQVTNFGDETTLSAQAQLLTFTKIGEETFPRATAAILDMATRMDGDLKGATLQVGKALNDPIAGLAALTKSGIQFTDQQKEQIKTLTQSGRLVEAQTIILNELEAQFGGSAKAARDADKGIIALGNSFGDLQESLGDLVLQSGSAQLAISALDLLIQDLTETVKTVNETSGKPGFDFLTGLGLTPEQIIKGSDLANKAFKKVAPILGSAATLWLVPPPIIGDAADKMFDKVAEAADKRGQEEKEQQKQGSQDIIEIEEEEADTILDLKRDFVRDLIDIQADTTEDLADLAKDRLKALTEAEEDGQERIADIIKDAGKDRLKIEEGLTRALGKDQKSEDKRIQETIKRGQKDEKRQRRLKAIDTKADERLFQFELRRLAADGEAIAIRDALERRSIEEEIAREKAAVEKDIESEKKEDQIAIIRETGRERRAQLQLDAQERQQLLTEREREEIVAVQEGLAERKQDLMEYYEDRRAQVTAADQEAIAKLGKSLTEVEDLTTVQLQELVKIAKDFGLEIGSQLAAGVDAGFAENTRIDNLLSIGGGASSASSASRATPSNLARSSRASRRFFQTGGPVGGPIGQPQAAVVHGGEVIANPNIGQAITIEGQTIAVHQAQLLADLINQRDQRNFQAFADELAESL